MLTGDYLEAKRIAERIALEVEPPRFYLERKGEVEISRRLMQKPMVRDALEIVESSDEGFGHGFSHVTKVAVDAGAIVIIERGGESDPETERMVLLAQISGVLHDIRRLEPEHALRGAEEARRILPSFDLCESEIQTVVHAIRNHEAFKGREEAENDSVQLISDSLYDADKFRWGPDNFTETVWWMVSRRSVPLGRLVENFLRGMEGIEKIKQSFRTPTGREYGPDFISRGLEIGMKLHPKLVELIAASGP